MHEPGSAGGMVEQEQDGDAWRLSASVVLLRRKSTPSDSADFEVLCQVRGKGISRAGMTTFPGGVMDPSDDDMKVAGAAEMSLSSALLRSIICCAWPSLVVPHAWESPSLLLTLSIFRPHIHFLLFSR